ncbi:carbohydrate-binding domain-containing protein [bacterium 1XD21-13]|nr:carbohydrate-binding domain-containing protein [bacterium 1XD21-13]
MVIRKEWKRMAGKGLVLVLTAALLGNAAALPAYAMQPSENQPTGTSEAELEKTASEVIGENGFEEEQPETEAANEGPDNKGFNNKESANKEIVSGETVDGETDGKTDSDTGLSHEHIDECYSSVEKCIHEHTAECYPHEGRNGADDGMENPEETDPVLCQHICSEESGCITRELHCPYEHKEEDDTQNQSKQEQTEDAGTSKEQDILADLDSQPTADETVAKSRAAGITYSMVKIDGQEYKDASGTVSLSLGGGTAVWEPDTAVLTLENVTMTKNIVIQPTVPDSATVTICLKGKNQIDISGYDDGTALLVTAHLVINAEENAELNIIANRGESLQIGIQCTHSLTMNGGNIRVDSNSAAIFAWGEAELTGVTLNLQSVHEAICAENGVQITGGSVTADAANAAAIYTPNGDINISDDAAVELKSSLNAMYAGVGVHITGGKVTAQTTGYPAIYSDSGDINISGDTVAELKSDYNVIFSSRGVNIAGGSVTAQSALALALYANGDINITGGVLTAESGGNTAIYADGSGGIHISGAGTEVCARGYVCALIASSGVEITGGKLTGHSQANHVIYTSGGFLTIQNADVTLTSDSSNGGLGTGLYLDNIAPIEITDSTVTVTTNVSSIVSQGDVVIRDSALTLKCAEGNGIAASGSDQGTLSISGDKTHIECESRYPLYGGAVTISGGYVNVTTFEGPAVSGMKGITVTGGEVHAKAVGTDSRLKPAAFYSSQGNITFAGAGTQVEAVSEHFRAVYTDNAIEGKILLDAPVTARAGADCEAFMACSNKTSNTPAPEHGIVIGEGYSAQGYLPVTTKWKEQYGGGYYAYTVLAPIGTENLQEDYFGDLPKDVDIVPAVYGISADPLRLDFGIVTYGKPEPEAKTVTITNTGNMPVTVALPQSGSYVVGTASNPTLAPGKTAVFTIQPKAGLVPGSYEEALVFSTDKSGVMKEIDAVFTVNKAVPVITTLPAAADRRYNPSITLKEIALSGGSVVGADGKLLAGTWTWQKEDTVPDAGSKGYAAIFTPDETGAYETAACTVPITVTKAVPYIALLPGASDITYGDPLSSSGFSGGTVVYGDGAGHAGSGAGSAETVAGTFTWKEPFEKPVAADSGKTEFEVIFTPLDTENYSSVEAKITLTVNKAPKAPNIPDNAISAARRFEKAGEVALPEGWAWQESDRDTELVIGVPVNVTAVYIGADKGNYIEETVIITITRSDCDHEAGAIVFTKEGEKAPTCTESGRGHRECSLCHEVMETGVAVAALGHSYTGRVTTAATVSSEGVRTYTCSRCGHQYTETIAKLPAPDSSQPGNGQSGSSRPEDDPPGDRKPNDGLLRNDGSQKQLGNKKEIQGDNSDGKEVRPEAGQPFIKGEARKEGWDVIRAEEDQAQEGSAIHIDMNGASVVPGDIFDRLKGRDIAITFDMGDGILWSVDGKSLLTDRAKDVDLSVKTDTNEIPIDIVNRLTGERDCIQLSLAHEGAFGFTAVLSVRLGSENQGLYANLFYYNRTAGEMEFISAGVIAEDGTAELPFTHASDYAIVIDKKPMDQRENAGEGAETPGMDGAADTDVKKDSGRNACIWAFAACGVLGLGGIGIFFAGRRKRGDAEGNQE